MKFPVLHIIFYLDISQHHCDGITQRQDYSGSLLGICSISAVQSEAHTETAKKSCFQFAWTRFGYTEIYSYYHFCFLKIMSWHLIIAESDCLLVLNSEISRIYLLFAVCDGDLMKNERLVLGCLSATFLWDWESCICCLVSKMHFHLLILPEEIKRCPFPSGGVVCRGETNLVPTLLSSGHNVRTRCFLRYFHFEKILQWGEGVLLEVVIHPQALLQIYVGSFEYTQTLRLKSYKEKKYTNTPVLICFLSQENGRDTTSVSHFSKTMGNITESLSLFLSFGYTAFTLQYLGKEKRIPGMVSSSLI